MRGKNHEARWRTNARREGEGRRWRIGRVRPSLLRLCRRSTDPQQTAEGVKRTEQTSAAATQTKTPHSPRKKGLPSPGSSRLTGNKTPKLPLIVLVEGHWERLMGGSEPREQSSELPASNQGPARAAADDLLILLEAHGLQPWRALRPLVH